VEPLIVTARLRNGFAASDSWSPALDAILGYWLLRERLGEAAFTAGAAYSAALGPVEGLPLERIDHGDWWWYACSSPIYTEAAQTLRYYHRRFDAQYSERHAAITRKRVEVKAGPYKASRLSEVVHTCPDVRWHVIGDAAEITRVLRRCTAIGARVGAGFGAVAEWEVSESGFTTDDMAADLARRHRPVPVEYARQNGIVGPEMIWGLRPPARLRGNQTLCVMPDAPG